MNHLAYLVDDDVCVFSKFELFDELEDACVVAVEGDTVHGCQRSAVIFCNNETPIACHYPQTNVHVKRHARIMAHAAAQHFALERLDVIPRTSM